MKIKKFLKWIIVFIITVLIIDYARFVFESSYYSFRKIDIPYNAVPLFFKNGLKEQMELASCEGSVLGDTICTYHYANKYGLIIFKMQNYDLVQPSHITMTKSNTDHVAFTNNTLYENIFSQVPSFGTISIRAKLTDVVDLKTVIDQHAIIDTSIRTNSYVYYSLDFDKLAIYSDQKLDIIIYKNTTFSKLNLMMYKYKGTFYLILYYSLNGSPVDDRELLNIIDLDKK